MDDLNSPCALILCHPEVALYPFGQAAALQKWFEDGVQRSYAFRNHLWKVPELKYEAIDGFFHVVNAETGKIHEVFSRAFLIFRGHTESAVSVLNVLTALSREFHENFLFLSDAGTHVWTPSSSGDPVESEVVPFAPGHGNESKIIENLLPMLRPHSCRFVIEKRRRQAWGFFEALILGTKYRTFNGRTAAENDAARLALRKYNSEMSEPAL